MERTIESIAAEQLKIISACSSLQNFSIQFEKGVGLRLDANAEDGQPRIELSIVDAELLPKSTDAVCSVDWRWIYDSVPVQIAVGAAAVKFSLAPVGPLVVSAGSWQGKPFLSFQPYKG